MRPQKLIMSAFGPYSGEEILEMEKLQGSGIYLITGDTGAGKTTIYDAITYALYGEASGENRKPDMLRSRYAKPETKTYVELEFEHRNKKYRIRRNPAYERPKLRGVGVAKETADASIEYLTADGSCEKIISGKISEVNEAIEGIIGLDKSQFSQVAMVAQGAFLKLLYAGTAEREKIFRQIFRTERWEKLQNRLKEEEKSASEKYKENLNRAQMQFSLISVPKDSEFAERLNEYKDSEANSFIFDDEKADFLTNIIEKDILLKKHLTKENQKLVDEIKEIEISRETAKGIADIIKKARTHSREAEIAKEESKAADNNMTLAEEKRPLAEEAVKKAALIKAELEKYDLAEELRSRVKEAEKAFMVAEEEAQKSKEAESSAHERIKSLSSHIAEWGSCEADLVKNESESEKAESEKRKAEEATEICRDFIAKLELARTAADDYVTIRDEYNNKSVEYENERKAFLDNQAGILATELSEGEKCPVCGSTVHPEPAKLKNTAVSKDQLDKLKKSVDKAAKEQEIYSSKANQLAGEANQSFLNVLKVIKDIDYKPEAEEEYNNEEKINFTKNVLQYCLEVSKKTSEIYKKLCFESEKLRKVIENKEAAKAEIKEIEAVLPEIERAAAERGKEAAELNLKITGLTEKLKDAEAGLSFKTKSEAEAEVKKHDDLKEKIEKEIDLSRKEAENKRRYAAEKATTAETYKTQAEEGIKKLGADPDEYLENIDNKLTELSEKAAEIRKKEEVTTLRLTKNREALDNLKKMLPELENSEEKLMLVRSLSDTASGKITGRDKVSLETFIQMEYFDRIIERANLRFLEMTGGQYELRRRTLAVGKLRNEGLELDVVDHYNNTVRNVKTLSGGEGFKAALSLALGTSDEIQESSGGVKLDTMFIDEGFGSLDEESVNQALKALAMLSENDRLVGIISHVETLKQRIESQIIVKKSQTGSRTEVKA